jgi:hypothetical protein
MRSAPLHYCWFLFLLASLAMQGTAMSTARPAQGNMLNPKNFEVLGVRLSDSTVTDVERILGPAPSKQGPNAETSTTCYTSMGSDRTILEFEYWFERVVEFRLFIGAPQSASRCTKSKLVSADLATSSGLRLGMSRDKVIALLGSPSKNSQTVSPMRFRMIALQHLKRSNFISTRTQPPRCQLTCTGKLTFVSDNRNWSGSTSSVEKMKITDSLVAPPAASLSTTHTRLYLR